MPRLPDLEPVVLGLLWKFGPCSAYAVRRHFEDSPSRGFSGSAGSIHPALERLRRRGEAARRAAPQGRRERSLWTATPAGVARLRAWLEPPLDEAEFDAPYDALRLRVYFLEALPPARRRACLLAAEEGLRAQVRRAAMYVRDVGGLGVASRLAARGLQLSAQSRLRWMEEVRATLGG